jgi:hypothetical protein
MTEVEKAAANLADLNLCKKDNWITGPDLQWQGQRAYTKADIRNALHSVELRDNKDYSKIWKGLEEWFDQFKK